MIIGKGLIASNFIEYQNNDSILFFCSGVSNSNETNQQEFKREEDLLINTILKNNDKKIIYFSTILIECNTPYYNHKKNMEQLIKKHSNNFLIFRIPQIIGNIGNKNNLVNFLVDSIKNEENIKIFKNIKRSVLDIDDLKKIILHCLYKNNNEIINLSHIEMIDIKELCDIISDLLNKKYTYQIIETNNLINWNIKNSNIIEKFISQLNKKDYTKRTLQKYIK